MEVSDVEISWLGRRGYTNALRDQRTRRVAVLEGTASEVLWLLEHEPVITTGRRPVDDLPSPESLRVAGVEVVATERGGLATWHGPGQLVGYLILDAARRGLGPKAVVRGIEEGIIRWLRSREIEGERRPGAPGIWVGKDKICAIGLHFRRGVSMHGFALNLSPDLSGFRWIVPCGIHDGGVTSFERISGRRISPEDVAFDVGKEVLGGMFDEKR